MSSKVNAFFLIFLCLALMLFAKFNGRIAMKTTRRQFLKESAKLIASGIVGATLLDKITQADQKDKDINLASKRGRVKLRQLGRTGMKVSVISVGTASTNENVIRYAIRRGINFIHTSIGYSGGRSIRAVGRAIKGHRKKLFLGLKVTWSWDSDDALNRALKILGTDYVDILFFNIHNNPDRVASPKAKAAFDRWKKQGKVKFMGLTTHGGMIECMNSALQTDWYDCLMPTYRLESREDYLEIFEKCKKQKVGFVAMKTGISPDDPDKTAAILKDKQITTICRTMRSMNDVKQYIAASNRRVGQVRLKRTNELAKLSALGRCAMCGACTMSCPSDLAVNDIVRCIDYYVDTMKDINIARENYADIPSSQNAQMCENCGQCESVCPNDVPIRHYISRAGRMFA